MIEKDIDRPLGVLLMGASGHAKVIADVMLASGRFSVAGVADADPAKVGRVIGGKPVMLDSDDALRSARQSGVIFAIIAIGDNAIRLRLGSRLRLLDFRMATIIDPSCRVSPSAKIGQGTVVLPGCVINADTSIGDECIVNTSASIDHDCSIGDGVHIAPGSHVCGGVTVGRGTFIGAGTVIIPGCHIGEDVVIGAGSTVVADIADGARVAGSPCRPL